MHDRAIIDEIVRRVSEKLAEADHSSAPATASETNAKRPRLLLLARQPSDLLGTYCHCADLNATRHVACFFPQDLDELDFDDLPTAPHVLVFDLTIDDLVQVASVTPQSNYTRTISKAIMQGSKVIVDDCGMGLDDCQETCPYGYYNLICSKKRFLKNCGVIFTSLEAFDNVAALLDGQTDREEEKEDPPAPAAPLVGSKPAYIWDRRVLTEQDLTRLLRDSHKVIALPRRTILTDLAREYVVRHNMELMFED